MSHKLGSPGIQAREHVTGVARTGHIADENKRFQVRSGQFFDAGGEHAIEALALLA